MGHIAEMRTDTEDLSTFTGLYWDQTWGPRIPSSPCGPGGPGKPWIKDGERADGFRHNDTK